MPELPEVETVSRGLRYLVGQRLTLLEVHDARVWFESEIKPSAFSGLLLESVARRGKYILFRFESATLVGHLRMTGKFLPEDSAAIPAEVRAGFGKKKGKGLQARARLRFERNGVVFFDTRRFGTLTAVRNEAKFFEKKKIAPDPILETAAAFEVFLQAMQRTKPLKALLLDQAAVAGVGNIYADEAIHAVGAHPAQSAYKFRDAARLWDAIQRILATAIEAGGSSVNDYVNASGEKGRFSSQLLVYGREGEPCRNCGKAIRRIQLAGRSTHFCPACQKKR